MTDEKKNTEHQDSHEPFVCDECGCQRPKAKGTNWCIDCESEYQLGLQQWRWPSNDDYEPVMDR